MVKKEIDVVDVHVTSKDRVDCFSQYPLLDGSKKYTVELTEFVCPLANQSALPDISFFEQNIFFEIRRKRLTADAVNVGHDDSSVPDLHYFLRTDIINLENQLRNHVKRQISAVLKVVYGIYQNKKQTYFSNF